jgi:REP element-mobilizing transposase RayT
MERRKRRRSFNTPHHAHALTFSTYRRRPFLLLPGVAEAFLARLDAARVKHAFEVWAYVVMPEHTWFQCEPYLSAFLKTPPKAQRSFGHSEGSFTEGKGAIRSVNFPICRAKKPIYPPLLPDLP